MNYRNRITEHIIIDSAELRRNPLNHRRHPDSQRHALRSLLSTVGVVDELLAYRDPIHGLTLVDGEARWSEGGSWPVAVLDLTPDEAMTVLAMLDKIGADAEIDPEALLALLDSLPQEARQTAGAAWSDDELAQLLADAQTLPEPGAGGDEFDPTPEDGPTRAQLGDLWIIGGVHRLLVGECTDPANVARLMDGERAAAIITDPPYGQNQEGVTNDDPEGLRALFDGYLAASPAENTVTIAFQSTRLFPTWLDAVRAAGHRFERALTYYDTGGWSTFPWRGWMPHSQIMLISSVGSPVWPKEPIHVRDVYSINNQLHGDDRLVAAHPTMKHLETVQSLIEHATDEGVVYDGFLGSGTTMIAAHRTGRRCYGMEIAPRYADVIIRRAEAEGLTVEHAPA
jgi:hypothetical protein